MTRRNGVPRGRKQFSIAQEIGRRKSAALAIAAVVSASAAAHASSISAPYSDTFSSDSPGQAANAVVSYQSGSNAAITWAVTTTTATTSYENILGPASSGNASSTYEVTNLSGVGFTESSKFTFTLATSTNTDRFGLAALGSAADFSNTPNSTNGIYADVSTGGATRINYTNNNATTTGPTGQVTSSTGTSVSLIQGDTYAETLTGTYSSGGALTISFTITDILGADAGSGDTLTYSPAVTFTGQYFGLRDNDSSSGNSGDDKVFYQSYSISAVPEPASLGCLTLSGIGFLRRRRRSSISS